MGCNFSALSVVVVVNLVVVYRDRGDKAGVTALTLCILIKTGDFHALLRVFNHFHMHLLQPTLILLLSLLSKMPFAEEHLR